MTPDQDRLADALRAGFGAILTDAQLESLATACECDDPRFSQCATVFPQALVCNYWRKWERCCAGAFMLDGDTVGERFTAWRKMMYEGHPDVLTRRWDFINLWDELTRPEALAATAAACRAMLAERERIRAA